MSDLFTGNLYTIVLDYRKKTYVYQVFAKNSVEANLKWIKEVDLNEIGIFNTKGIKEELISEAMDETFFPVSMNNLQCVWSSSVTSFSEVDIHTKEYPVAYIITTSTTNCKYIQKKQQNDMLGFSNNKVLYTIQLDYKGSTGVNQVCANTQIEAKIKWIQQLKMNEFPGAPTNIPETKNNLLSQTKDPDFNPIPINGLDSVWSTSVQLGDEIGRVTIVATQSNVVNL